MNGLCPEKRLRLGHSQTVKWRQRNGLHWPLTTLQRGFYPCGIEAILTTKGLKIDGWRVVHTVLVMDCLPLATFHLSQTLFSKERETRKRFQRLGGENTQENASRFLGIDYRPCSAALEEPCLANGLEGPDNLTRSHVWRWQYCVKSIGNNSVTPQANSWFGFRKHFHSNHGCWVAYFSCVQLQYDLKKKQEDWFIS